MLCPKQQTFFLILAVVSLPISTNAFITGSFFGENSSSQKKQATTKTKVQVASSSSSFDRRPVSLLSSNRSRRRRISSSSSSSANKAVLPLLDAIRLPQSRKNRNKVETMIEELSMKADKNKATMKRPIQPGSYRTVWSTVTSDSILGTILQKPPSNVLGGPSWQIISKDMSQGENIVYWEFCDIRMAGLARLSPLDTGAASGYSLSISGLEFRWGANGCPEKEAKPFGGNNNSNTNKGNTLRLFYLDDEETTLGNGVGTLKVLYNDGTVRITRDEIQQNTYMHVKEPLNDEFENFFAPN